MSNEPVVWKAYEEVHFNDQYILRWVREGDEYVNKITKEMMEDLKSVVRQQQAEIEVLKAGKIKAYDNGYEDGRKPNTHPVSQYKAITNTKIEPTVVSYTHPSEHDLGIAEAIGFEKGHKSAEDMLRQQQAEIDRLTMLCDCMTTESNRKGNEIEELKAHPVKELTDEEIIKVYEDMLGVASAKGSAIDFARAIEKRIKNGN